MGRWLLGVAACGLLVLVAGAWAGLWTGEGPVWERARVGATPRSGGLPFWTLDWPSVPRDNVWFSAFPEATSLAILALLVASVVFTLFVEHRAARRYEPLALIGATVTVAGVICASRAAHFMAVYIVDGTEAPGALDDAVWMLVAGATLSALACARIALLRPRRDGATLALASLVTALAASYICERHLVRPDHARPALVEAGFERAEVPNVPPTRVFLLPYEDADEVLEVSFEGAIVHVGPVPGAGPRVPWPASELGARLAELAARMPSAPLAPGSADMVPDGALHLRIDGRAPASVLVALQDAAGAVGIWKLGLLYTIESIGPEAALLMYLPKRGLTVAPVAADLTLLREPSGGVAVSLAGQPVEWEGERLVLPDAYTLKVAADLPMRALIDVVGRIGAWILGPITLVAPR